MNALFTRTQSQYPVQPVMADDTNAWDLREDGSWERRTPDPREPRTAQRELMDGHAARAAEAQQT